LFTEIDFCIFSVYRKNKPRGSVNFRPGSNPLKVQNRIEKLRGAWRGNWITEKPCRDENEAFEALVGTAVNTVPGLLAKLAYLQELAQSNEWSWVIEERDGTALHLIESFAASLANISAVPMAVQS
jgi:hypothetical protein